MGEDKKVPEKINVPVLEVKRGNVTISSSGRNPQVYNANEMVSWKEGNIQISGVGTNRAEALAALDESYGKLKDVLSRAV